MEIKDHLKYLKSCSYVHVYIFYDNDNHSADVYIY